MCIIFTELQSDTQILDISGKAMKLIESNRERYPCTLGDAVKLACAVSCGRDAFEILANTPTAVRRIIGIPKYGQRAWSKSCIAKSAHGDIVFIHIPKCAGTAIARSFGVHEIGHWPAFMLYESDRKR